VGNNFHTCDYGCGKEATHQFKNGKWCCCKTTSSCLEKRKRNKTLFKKGHISWKKGLTKETDYRLKKLSESLIGNKPSLEIRKKMSNSAKNRFNNPDERKRIIHTYTINFLRNKHKKFFEIEDIRENVNIDEMVKIQVRCKNPECINSKENNGWFTPTRSKINERIRQIENLKGNQKSFFYCCLECKNIYKRKYEYKKYKNPNLNFILYKNIVNIKTEKQIKIYKDKIEKIELRGKKFHIDHLFSISNGFKNGILPEIISCYKNLKIVESYKNLIKSGKNEITKEELFFRFNDYLKEIL
jgi:hypothetical protein